MPQNRYQKFIILSAPRSGTNYVLHLLASHPDIRAYGELFQPNFLIGNPRDTVFEQPLFFRLYRTFRPWVPLFFLRRVIFRPYPAHIRAVGFKIFYEHCRDGASRAVWPYLRHLTDVKIVHILRDNLLENLVSRRIAELTGDYLVIGDRPEPKHVRIRLSFGECLGYFRQAERWRKEYGGYFSDHSVHTVRYEDLVRDPETVLADLQRFLDVPIRKLTADVRKQNTHPMASVIINYAGLRKKFSGTPYAAFFTV